MAGNNGNTAATHFGRQMRKERMAHGWTLRELATRTGIDFSYLSRVENGRRAPSEKVAEACDQVFPERRGWFTDWHDESRAWSEIPAGFRSWADVEEKAASLQDWWPSIVSGLLQTEAYARAVLSAAPAVTDETIRARLAARIERQRRVLDRDHPPKAWFVVDEFALYRFIGTAEVMAGQMRKLADVAALPNVTLTVMPATVHPGNESGFMVAGDTAYAEHVAGGYVFTDDQTVSGLAERFDSLRAESYRASESAAIIKKVGEVWATGASPAFQAATEARA